jgi:hypothetical protein
MTFEKIAYLLAHCLKCFRFGKCLPCSLHMTWHCSTKNDKHLQHLKCSALRHDMRRGRMAHGAFFSELVRTGVTWRSWNSIDLTGICLIILLNPWAALYGGGESVERCMKGSNLMTSIVSDEETIPQISAPLECVSRRWGIKVQTMVQEFSSWLIWSCSSAIFKTYFMNPRDQRSFFVNWHS